MEKPIGIFDSGIGGLTVFEAIRKKLPYEDIIYFGDTARLPYGSKSKQTIIKFSLQIVRFLLKKNVKIVVIACNTASSLAYQELKKIIKVPILDVVKPAVQQAAKLTKNKKVGVIGTQATINSKAYENTFSLIDKTIKVYSVACPLLVPLIEENWMQINKKMIETAVEIYLLPLKQKNIDTLILGCTHYPIIKDFIDEFFDRKVNLVDSSTVLADDLYLTLQKFNLFKKDDKLGKNIFYVSDSPNSFIKSAETFMKFNTINVRRVNIEEY